MFLHENPQKYWIINSYLSYPGNEFSSPLLNFNAQTMRLLMDMLYGTPKQLHKKYQVPANLPPCHLTTLPPFPTCHLTTLMHLSHISSSLLSCLSQLTTLPTTNRSLKNSNVLPLGRQGKHIRLIVRQLLMKAGWWNAPLVLPTGFSQSNQHHQKWDPLWFDRNSTFSLYTSLRLRILCTCSPPTHHFHSASRQSRISNPVGGLWWSFLAETVYVLRQLAVFAEKIHRCLNSFVLILLIHTKHKYKNMKSCTDPASSFPWRRTHPLGSQGKNRVTNSRAAAIKAGCWNHPPWAPVF